MTWIEKVLSGDKLIMMGDFNCKEVCWEQWYTEGTESSWRNKLLQLAVDNILTQWIKGDTRFGKDGETSRLDLLFSKEPEEIENVHTRCPLAKSDHATIEFNINEEIENQRNEEHYAGRLNYWKPDFDNMNFFQEERWDMFHKATRVQQK